MEGVGVGGGSGCGNVWGAGAHKLFTTSFSSLKKQSKQNCPEQFASSAVLPRLLLHHSWSLCTVAGPVLVLEVALRNHCRRSRLAFLIKQNGLLVGSFPGKVFPVNKYCESK